MCRLAALFWLSTISSLSLAAFLSTFHLPSPLSHSSFSLQLCVVCANTEVTVGKQRVMNHSVNYSKPTRAQATRDCECVQVGKRYLLKR